LKEEKEQRIERKKEWDVVVHGIPSQNVICKYPAAYPLNSVIAS